MGNTLRRPAQATSAQAAPLRASWISYSIHAGLFFASSFTMLLPAVGAELPTTVYPSFRVETDLYEGNETTPQSQHLILFDAGVVYDLPVQHGSVVTVFDIPRNRVVLIHKATRVRTSISTDTLIQMAAQLRAAASDGGSKDLGLNAEINPGVKPDSYVVEFGANRYEVTTQLVNDPAVAAEFASFTAWASRLNMARHVGAPPFARIALADQLASANRLPKQLTLDVRRALTKERFRSENLFVERLCDLDRKKISEVGGMMATYPEVDFSEFPAD
jgi:hypothetical protein